MAWVVFLRGANVGGHKKFQPIALAKELVDLDVVNVGAAGTFVVRGRISAASLRAEILQRLPFSAKLMICPAREIINLARDEALARRPLEKGVRRFVSIMQKPPRTVPPLPLAWPADGQWAVKLVGVSGRYAWSLRRRLGRTTLYPNEVVEKSLGESATTRAWDTIRTICRILEDT